MPPALQQRRPSPTKRPPREAPTGADVAVEGGNGRLIQASDLALLEELDDVIFAALAGDAPALDRSARLWRRVRSVAPTALVEESREQYSRRAEEVCQRYLAEPNETLARAFAAAEVSAMLAE
ncbi:MAG: hypothetical protein AAGB00_05315 [Planctomycetota bacterium]